MSHNPQSQSPCCLMANSATAVHGYVDRELLANLVSREIMVILNVAQDASSQQLGDQLTVENWRRGTQSVPTSSAHHQILSKIRTMTRGYD
jgi:hypothetical protein